MRERATAFGVTPGPWQTDEHLREVWHSSGDHEVVVSSFLHGADPDFPHIASWHPTVALAVADWLDADTNLIVQFGVDPEPSKALAVARAYLGET